MTEGQRGWILLFLLSLILIIIGIQGDLGLTIGILFDPTDILIGNEFAQPGQGLPGTTGTNPSGKNCVMPPQASLTQVEEYCACMYGSGTAGYKACLKIYASA